MRTKHSDNDLVRSRLGLSYVFRTEQFAERYGLPYEMTFNMGFPSDGEANQGWKLYLTSLVMIIVAGLTVVARIVVRLRGDVALRADDYAIVASLVSPVYARWCSD